MLAWGSCGRNGRNGGNEELGAIRTGFSKWENLQVLLSMSARRHSLGQLQSAGGVGSGGQGRGDLIQLYFTDLDRWLCICIVWDVAGDFRCVGFEGGLEGLDRLEGQMPHRQKGWGRACHKTSHSFLYINPFEGRAGQATHKRDVLREVVLHVEDLPLAVRVQHADSDHVPSFKTVMAFPSCSTRLNPCVSRRVNWVVHLIRGVAQNGGNRKSGSFAVALKKRRVRGLARFLRRNLGSKDSVNQGISRKKL